MADRPEELPEWDVNNTQSIRPAQSYIDNGFAPSDRPPAQWFNWLMQQQGKWLQYFAAGNDVWLDALDGVEANHVIEGVAPDPFSGDAYAYTTNSVNSTLEGVYRLGAGKGRIGGPLDFVAASGQPGPVASSSLQFAQIASVGGGLQVAVYFNDGPWYGGATAITQVVLAGGGGVAAQGLIHVPGLNWWLTLSSQASDLHLHRITGDLDGVTAWEARGVASGITSVRGYAYGGGDLIVASPGTGGANDRVLIYSLALGTVTSGSTNHAGDVTGIGFSEQEQLFWAVDDQGNVRTKPAVGGAWAAVTATGTGLSLITTAYDISVAPNGDIFVAANISAEAGGSADGYGVVYSQDAGVTWKVKRLSAAGVLGGSGSRPVDGSARITYANDAVYIPGPDGTLFVKPAF